VAPSGGHTQSEQETLDLLLDVHFPNSVVIEERVAAACPVKRLDWWVATKVVTYGRVVWAIDSFAPYKMGWTGYSRLCYKRNGRSLSLTWLRFFMSAGNWLCSSNMAPGQGGVYT
jgi:hypothetical protein